MEQNKNYDELLDIVNENDQIIGQKLRSEVQKKGLNSFRLINAFLVNDKGELWIPRRAAHKKLFPLCLGSSVGGHVSAGENYDQAFERELLEELKINLSEVKYKFAIKLTPNKHKVSAYMYVYIINTNITPAHNSNDFIEAIWITISDLKEKIKNGERTNEDLPILINILEDIIKV